MAWDGECDGSAGVTFIYTPRYDTGVDFGCGRIGFTVSWVGKSGLFGYMEAGLILCMEAGLI